MVLLTFLFTCFQGQQSTAAANDQQYVTDISQSSATADSGNKLDSALVLYVGSPMAIINNDKKPIDPANPKVRPFSQDAVVFAPVRFIGESLGGKVTWDQSTKTASIVLGSNTIKLSPGSKVMLVNNTAVNLDFPVIGDNGRILVPVNQLAEAVGMHVFYDRGLIIISKVINLFDKTADKVLIDDIISDISQPPSVETAEGLKSLLGKIKDSLLESSLSNPYLYRMDSMKSREMAADAAVSAANEASAIQGSSVGTPEYSGTNVQVQGVDEADVVKTDGKYIYQVNKGRVVITEAYPASGLKVSGTISFTDGNFSPLELYIENDILTVIGQSNASIPIYMNSPVDMKVKYPVCLGGKLACPPDDCGSIPGYYICIQTFKDQKDKELLEWMGDWNPEYFTPQDITFEDPRKRFLESWE